MHGIPQGIPIFVHCHVSFIGLFASPGRDFRRTHRCLFAPCGIPTAYPQIGKCGSGEFLPYRSLGHMGRAYPDISVGSVVGRRTNYIVLYRNNN